MLALVLPIDCRTITIYPSCPPVWSSATDGGRAMGAAFDIDFLVWPSTCVVVVLSLERGRRQGRRASLLIFFQKFEILIWFPCDITLGVSKRSHVPSALRMWPTYLGTFWRLRYISLDKLYIYLQWFRFQGRPQRKRNHHQACVAGVGRTVEHVNDLITSSGSDSLTCTYNPAHDAYMHMVVYNALLPQE